MKNGYDALIIGTGQAGPFLARRLSEAGMAVAIVERHLFGGTCVNTGCIPTKAMVARASPPMPGVDRVPYLTNSSMMGLDLAPSHLLIVGGGYVGLEFGQMFRRFGSQVTIIDMGPRLVQHEDEDVSTAIHDILTSEGIDVRGFDGRLHTLIRVPVGEGVRDVVDDRRTGRPGTGNEDVVAKRQTALFSTISSLVSAASRFRGRFSRGSLRKAPSRA